MRWLALCIDPEAPLDGPELLLLPCDQALLDSVGRQIAAFHEFQKIRPRIVELCERDEGDRRARAAIAPVYGSEVEDDLANNDHGLMSPDFSDDFEKLPDIVEQTRTISPHKDGDFLICWEVRDRYNDYWSVDLELSKLKFYVAEAGKASARD